MIMKNLENKLEDKKVCDLLDNLRSGTKLSKEEFVYILDNIDESAFSYLKKLSREVTDKTYGKTVYLRGLIEISNYCKRSCNYCGIRKENLEIERYRLTKEEILASCETGYKLGYKTFVMQGGEDNYYSKEVLSDIISTIKNNYPDVAITLSIGERSYEDYKAFYEAGADRFLLRHEAYSKRLYKHLHPESMSYENRIECIKNLKEIGFQAGIGMMVGSPTQTNEDLASDLVFIQDFSPAMCGIGPYINHEQTPFKNEQTANLVHTVVMVALVRLILPSCLLPATTALATLDKESRLEALRIGANVVMPNLSPMSARKSYEIYQGKKISGNEAAEEKDTIIKEIEDAGLKVELVRGDCIMEEYNVYK